MGEGGPGGRETGPLTLTPPPTSYLDIHLKSCAEYTKLNMSYDQVQLMIAAKLFLSLSQCTLPVTIDHSRRNRLFPSQSIITVAIDHSRRNALFPSQSIIPVAKNHSRRNRSLPSQRVIPVAGDYYRRISFPSQEIFPGAIHSSRCNRLFPSQ